jgi:hypothetical protein
MGIVQFEIELGASHEPDTFVRGTGFSLPQHRPKSERPPDRMNPGLRTPVPRFKGIMHGRMAVTAPQEEPEIRPVRVVAPPAIG